jgi:hypothetical protein
MKKPSGVTKTVQGVQLAKSKAVSKFAKSQPKSAFAKGGGAHTVAIRAAPAYKAPKAPGLPAAMATPAAPKPKAPPSLANIAMSRNPQMLKMGGRSKKK